MESSTKRLIRRAVAELHAGHDVVIVAYPHNLSVAIARTVCRVARERSVVCVNLPECKEGPRVSVREYNAPIAFPTPKAVVLIDVSAVFERQRLRPSAVRSVGGL